MTSNNLAAQTSLREMNLSLVLRFIYHDAPLSRAQLAGKTGLNKSTISSLVEAAAVVVDDILTHLSHVEKEVMPHNEFSAMAV